MWTKLVGNFCFVGQTGTSCSSKNDTPTLEGKQKLTDITNTNTEPKAKAARTSRSFGVRWICLFPVTVS